MEIKQILLLVLLIGLIGVPHSMADGWLEWGEWFPCTTSCAGGVTIRIRECGGTDCVGDESQTGLCNTEGCPVDGSWTGFTNWSPCSASCEGGNKTRTRSCSDPAPAYGGAECEGDEAEVEECNLQECPIDGDWSSWTQWTSCNTDCLQFRYRSCDDPEPEYGGAECDGDDIQELQCSILNCPLDGQWTEWHEQNCDASCRGRKVRYCDNPQPLRGGADCIGPRVEEYGNCSSFDCIQDGAWGSWNEWSDCSKSCSYGIQTRYRECDSPWPRNGGAPCPSSDSYISERTCYIDKCPKPLVHRKKYKPKSSDRDVDYALILSIIFGVLGGLTLILLIILTIRRTQLKKMRDKAVEEREKTPLYKEAAEMSVIPVGKRSAAAKLRRQNLKAKLKKPDEKKRPTTFIDTVFQFNEEFDDIGRPQSSLLRSDSVLSRPETATFDRPESRQVTLDSRADTPMMVKGLKQIDQQLREIGSVNPNDSVAGMTSLEAVLGITPGGKKLPSLGQETVGTNRLPPILPRGLPSLDAAMSTKGLKPVGVLPSLQVNTNSNTLKVPVTTHPQQLKGQGITLDEAMGGGKTSTKDSNAPMSREEEVDEIVENFWEVPRESIEMITTLATGSFGLVMKAKAWDLLSSQGASLVVIKELDPQASVATRNAFLKQLDVLKKLDTHTNVISLLGCCTILDPLYMVLEYAPNGELQSFLRRNRPHTPGAKPPVSKNLMNFAVQIAKGMAFLHKHKVSHGELSSQNILLGDRLVCKVSNVARVRNVVENVAEGRLGLRWMSPESICASVQNEQSDSWSFGVLLWEIVNFGSTPYPNMSEKDIKTRIKVGYRMPHSAHITKDLYNLMKYCWNDVPSKRPPLKALASTIWKMNVEGIEHIKVNEFNSKLCVDMDDMRPHTPGSILC